MRPHDHIAQASALFLDPNIVEQRKVYSIYYMQYSNLTLEGERAVEAVVVEV